MARAASAGIRRPLTLFLDEIGDMALATQTKILRVLQQGEIQRVGGTEVIRVEVRVLAATNKNIEEMVRAKTFREDLAPITPWMLQFQISNFRFQTR